MPVLKTLIFGTWLACAALGAIIGGLRAGFDQVKEGGTLQPYMVRRPFSHWRTVA
jgi:hypothetical protein